MVYVNAFLMRAGSNAVLWVYIDHATRSRRSAITQTLGLTDATFRLKANYSA